jgi:type II secretion system protein N
VIPWVAYPALYLVLLVAFAYLAFPYERVEKRIILGYAQSQATSPEPKRMQIGDTTWSWRFPGVVLEDVQLIGPKPKAKPDGAEPEKRAVIHIESAYVGVSVLPLLIGTTRVVFDIDGFGGELSGSFRKSNDDVRLEVELDEIKPGQLPGVAEALQLPMEGSLSGTINLSLPEGKYSAAEGEVRLELEGLSLGDGETSIRGLLALPTANAGTLTVEATASQGRVKLDKFAASGEDLELSADGRLRLREPLLSSNIEQMNLSFKFTDKYRDTSDITRSLLGKPGEARGGLIDMDPKVKRAKGPDGVYNWKVSGRLDALVFAPGMSAPLRAQPNPQSPQATPPSTP